MWPPGEVTEGGIGLRPQPMTGGGDGRRGDEMRELRLPEPGAGGGQRRPALIPVVVDMWAPWCGPCRMVSPALEQVATELAGRIKLVKVNVDDSPKLQQRFNVMAIPTLMVLRHGQVAAQRAGAVPAASLRAWVEEVLGN